jgi:hypothetical protein
MDTFLNYDQFYLNYSPALPVAVPFFAAGSVGNGTYGRVHRHPYFGLRTSFGELS